MKRVIQKLAALTFVTGATAAALILPAFTQTGGSAPAQKIIALPPIPAWTGDFDGMRQRNLIRILVVTSKTNFFQDKGRLLGATAEAGLELERWLDKKYGSKPQKLQVAFIPTTRERLLQELRAGKGDIAAANLTVTPERSAMADFVSPWISDVTEVLVTGPAARQLAGISELDGGEIMVRKSSSYYTHLTALNETISKRRGRPIDIVAADESLEDEDLLEMVSAGLLPWAVVDVHKARLWTKIYRGLTVREDIVFHTGGEIAWAIRRGSPQLKAELNRFVAEQRKKPEMPDVWRRYFITGETIRNALAKKDIDAFRSLLVHFDTSGTETAIDPYLLAAQGYKESQLNQGLRMKSGAVGIMQIKPSTAREKAIGINDVVTHARDNIRAGAKYVRYLAEKYVNDPAVDERNRVLMALAAYNAGPGNLRKFRDYADKHGFDRNVWFGNVEAGAAAIIGQETVRYVRDIYKYYVTYAALAARERRAQSAPGEQRP